MSGERKPSFWVVKHKDGSYLQGAAPNSHGNTFGRRYGRAELDEPKARHAVSLWPEWPLRAVPVYVRKVKKARKLTDAQRNAVAEHLRRTFLPGFVVVPQAIDDAIDDIRSGKAGL